MDKETRLPKPKTAKDERFIVLWNEILKSFRIKSNRDFLIKNDLPADLISKIERGLVSVQDSFIALLESQFKINPGYIHGLSNEFFKKDNQEVDYKIEYEKEVLKRESLETKIKDLEDKIKLLEGTVQDKQTIIEVFKQNNLKMEEVILKRLGK